VLPVAPGVGKSLFDDVRDPGGRGPCSIPGERGSVVNIGGAPGCTQFGERPLMFAPGSAREGPPWKVEVEELGNAGFMPYGERMLSIVSSYRIVSSSGTSESVPRRALSMM
jgi:hypothetical protein